MLGSAFVHVIDDDEGVRDSLSALLAAAGFAVNTYPSAPAFLHHLPALSGGCVVTDLQMPDMNGLELLRRMQGRLADFPMIVVTGHAKVSEAVEALKAGASDFIEKPIDPAAVLAAVRRAVEQLADAPWRDGAEAGYVQRLAALSAREKDVLQGLVAGWSNKLIARELGISPRTVENYRASLMMKMQASSLSELVRMALLGAGGPEPRRGQPLRDRPVTTE